MPKDPKTRWKTKTVLEGLFKDPLEVKSETSIVPVKTAAPESSPKAVDEDAANFFLAQLPEEFQRFVRVRDHQWADPEAKNVFLECLETAWIAHKNGLIEQRDKHLDIAEVLYSLDAVDNKWLPLLRREVFRDARVLIQEDGKPLLLNRQKNAQLWREGPSLEEAWRLEPLRRVSILVPLSAMKALDRVMHELGAPFEDFWVATRLDEIDPLLIGQIGRIGIAIAYWE
jgi:hypothetical protein